MGFVLKGNIQYAVLLGAMSLFCLLFNIADILRSICKKLPSNLEKGRGDLAKIQNELRVIQSGIQGLRDDMQYYFSEEDDDENSDDPEEDDENGDDSEEEQENNEPTDGSR